MGSDHAPSCLQEKVRCSFRWSSQLESRSQRSGNHSQHCSLNQILQGLSSPQNHPLRGHPLQQHFLPWDPPQDPLRLPPQSLLLMDCAAAVEVPLPAAFWIGCFLGGRLDVGALMVGVIGVLGWRFAAGWDLRAASLGEAHVG
ncbi:hypothetical protein PIB30_087268, partial [Stylosanthes scabra]|nr:hypothetical protein [Stylosanthes scabra]